MSLDAHRPLVTVYVTCRNYGAYLRQSLDSVLDQTLDDWEALIFDDGSTDDSRTVAEEYARRHPDRIRLFATDAPRGLRACANEAIRQARGRYLVRLDADDYLDESALLVLSSRLEGDRDLALVYPNWTYVGEDGRFLGIERRKAHGRETEVSDLPPHGACTMVRLRALKTTGGYDESFDSQDGHELWLKLLHRFKVGSVATPLFFYRQHGASMSRNEERLLSARRAIKRQAANRWAGPTSPRVLGVVPVKNSYRDMRNVALDDVAGKPLIDWTLDAAIGADCFDTVYVTTDDPNVVRHCEQRGDVLADTRPGDLSAPTSRLSDVLVHAVTQLEKTHAIFEDVVVLLNIHCPLRTSEHIREAVDTLLLYDTDHVLSTYEDLDVHFRHGRDGLEPLNPGMTNQLRFEREALLVDNGAIHALWRDLVDPDIRLSGRIGHTVMSRAESFQIKSSFDRTLAAAMIQARIEDGRHDRGREQQAGVDGLAWPARPPARGGDRR